MPIQYTDLLGLMYPDNTGDLLPHTDLENSAKAIDSYLATSLAHLLPKGGFLLSTDFNLSAGTGMEVIVSSGGVFNLTANGPKLNVIGITESLTPSNSGLLASTTNYIWKNGDRTTTVNQTGTAPTSGSQLAGTAVTSSTVPTTFNNAPTGRYNLDQRYTQTSVTWDPPSIANGAAANTTVTVTGVRVGDQIAVSPITALTAGMFLIPAQVTANDTLRLVLVNFSGGTVDLGSLTINVTVRKF